MENQKRRKTAILAASLGIMITMGVGAREAWAGYKLGETVVVSTGSRFGYGSMGSARNSGDANQYIECRVTWVSGYNTVNCYARDSAGTVVTCISTNAAAAKTVAAMKDNSRVRFDYDPLGNCTNISFSNASFYGPPVP